MKKIIKKELEAPISEIFTSIQGEGFGIGMPSVFIRFWGCNLRCRFNGKECDTPYSVFDFEKNSLMKDVSYVVDKIKNSGVNHIVYTGGEPLIYQDFIIEVMKKLTSFTCEIETNGTIPIRDEDTFDKIVSWFNISVKLKSSNQENKSYDKKRIFYPALNTFPISKSYFKFVYNNKNDLDEILELKKRYNLPIYLMPEGIDRAAIIKHSEEVVELCIKHNFRFSPREHIMIWDKKRGI